jgi:hypothetical protein
MTRLRPLAGCEAIRLLIWSSHIIAVDRHRLGTALPPAAATWLTDEGRFPCARRMSYQRTHNPLRETDKRGVRLRVLLVAPFKATRLPTTARTGPFSLPQPYGEQPRCRSVATRDLANRSSNIVRQISIAPLYRRIHSLTPAELQSSLARTGSLPIFASAGSPERQYFDQKCPGVCALLATDTRE